jgi:hypothetical protein
MTGAALSSTPLNSRSRAATNPWAAAAVVVVPTDEVLTRHLIGQEATAIRQSSINRS